jgi:tetratricopeptide (TPR) repeat protein
MTRKTKKWIKGILITFGSILTLIIILALVFNQLTFRVLLGLGYMDVYNGNNDRGNQLMSYAISKIDSPTGEMYHSQSVQNTKNGNYDIAISALDKAYELIPEEASAYYGWVLLYYYHDYERALEILEINDAYTPNFPDAPMAEDIHYLKGLAHMQLTHYEKAIEEFNWYINYLDSTSGEKYVDVYTFVQKGRCLTQLGRFDEAVKSHQRAIRNYAECTEAFYYLGLTQLEMKQNDSACVNFNKALKLIKDGYKSSDNYVEYFHEVYQGQIEKNINENCN